MEAAISSGVRVSFDGNYRGKLWSEWNGDGPGILRRLLEHADVAFADERDIALVLGVGITGATPIERRRLAAEAAFTAFPRLHRIASTFREILGPDEHRLTGALFTRSGEHVTPPFHLSRIVDRIGGGDAFAAGFLCGIGEGRNDRDALDIAVACACLKHGVFGDFHQINRAEIDDVLAGGGGDVRR